VAAGLAAGQPYDQAFVEERYMASNNLTEALDLVERAEQELDTVRLETPVGYMDTDEGRYDVTGKLRSIDDQYLEKAVVLMDGATDEDLATFGQRFKPVNRALSYIAGEATAGRLPMRADEPWPPQEWVVEDNMREEAEEAAAEPATNGYEEVPDAQGADNESVGG